MAARASRASSGLASKTLRPEPAWIAMMPMLCATMSCSSRAIRSRSAIAAWAAAWARSSSARACACRIECPISQAMIVTRGTAIVTRCTADPPTAVPERTPETALPGAESAGRRCDHGDAGRPRLCGCVSPPCSRSQGPLRRRRTTSARTTGLGCSAMLATDPPSSHGQRRERPAAQQESGSQQGAAKHRESPHDHRAPPARRVMLMAAIVAAWPGRVVCLRAYARGQTRHRADVPAGRRGAPPDCGIFFP